MYTQRHTYILAQLVEQAVPLITEPFLQAGQSTLQEFMAWNRGLTGTLAELPFPTAWSLKASQGLSVVSSSTLLHWLRPPKSICSERNAGKADCPFIFLFVTG